MSDIPEARLELKAIAKELEARGLPSFARRIRQVVRSQMHRKEWVTRSPAHHQTMTAELGEEVRRLHRKFPRMSQATISEKLNIGLGRVSEALNGKKWK